MSDSLAAPALARAQTDPTDRRFMRLALGLARRGLGNVWPNPTVGCVLIRDDRVVGRGWTQPGGRPHAETMALRQAGILAQGATAYVSLEPCCHHGKTPPCADALVAAGVARAVVAALDPDPRVAGGGVERLLSNDIETDCGVLEAEALSLNAGFVSRILRGRPHLSLKLATTLDGRIATRSGASQWITGERARQWGHLMRAQNDAVMVGSGTASVDDPSLTCRLPGLVTRSPVRVIADADLRLSPKSKLAQSAGRVPIWLLTRDSRTSAGRTLKALGVELIETAEGTGGHVDLADGLAGLAARGITRVLVEGGKGLATALLEARLVDEIFWFRAPGLIGDDGLPALGSFGIDAVESLHRFERRSVTVIGDDVLETYSVPT